mmetsp:Transcript_35393/g.44705  ORF Transcript_35393/g.44705 Transcript_35393/m.44705 type:complete len:167 (+) Transcript_35393:129-629(+)
MLRLSHTPLFSGRQSQVMKDEREKFAGAHFPRPLNSDYTRAAPLDTGRDTFGEPLVDHISVSLPVRSTPLPQTRHKAPAFKERDESTEVFCRPPYLRPANSQKVVQSAPLNCRRSSRSSSLMDDELRKELPPAPPVKVEGHIPLNRRRNTWDEDTVISVLDDIQTF